MFSLLLSVSLFLSLFLFLNLTLSYSIYLFYLCWRFTKIFSLPLTYIISLFISLILNISLSHFLSHTFFPLPHTLFFSLRVCPSIHFTLSFSNSYTHIKCSLSLSISLVPNIFLFAYHKKVTNCTIFYSSEKVEDSKYCFKNEHSERTIITNLVWPFVCTYVRFFLKI